LIKEPQTPELALVFTEPIVTLTAVDVVLEFLLSVALAVSEYEPAPAFDQVKRNGAAVTPPSREPLAKNSTLLTVPSGSVASALIEMVAGAVNVLPFVGEVMLTAGGVFFFPLPWPYAITEAAKNRPNKPAPQKGKYPIGLCFDIGDAPGNLYVPRITGRVLADTP
jgi:hypothetical protein